MKTVGKRYTAAFWIVACFSFLVGLYSIMVYTFASEPAPMIATKLSLGEVLDQTWYLFLYIHVFCSSLAIMTGPFQFIGGLRKRFPGLHRRLGMLYMLCIGGGGLSGLYLAFFATGGWFAGMGFAALSLLWMWTAWRGLQHIRAANVQEHRKWMIRNFALTCAAITLRIYLPLSIVTFGLAPYETYYTWISWLCWLPNLFVAEWYIRRKFSIYRKYLSQQ
ncbi:DUF2306 domain-containing protein [Brevibacillus humidisoli]|uniref:DUF2306 domain-containing protein n=1 Tax=Brevibacillus humidisoli TaxID=2895522 RepID=UPI001E5967FC|nr:DUF2306 domain-containing protein [Brevibacillus humidisoli]UFJ41270.1 DUF2306 domain-containing protein [Brevibacillus humidisoli]